MNESKLVRVHSNSATGRPNAREWLVSAHDQLKSMIPPGKPPALLTDDMKGPEGKPVDVFKHFGRSPKSLNSLILNYNGIVHTAQAAGADARTGTPLPEWPGFDDVWIPVAEGLELYGRLGLAEGPSGVLDTDCIIILPGMLGDNNVYRTRDLAMALRKRGFHALAVEVRGHGCTDARYPDVYYGFAVLESGDLLAVDEWLRAQPHVRRTGLVGFCWGANTALVSAWFEGMPDRGPPITPALAGLLRPVSSQRHFEAGVMAFSPVLRFEELMDQMETPQSYLKRPLLASQQSTNRQRMEHKNHTPTSGSLTGLILHEFSHTSLRYPQGLPDALTYLRFLPHHEKPADDKLARMRMPVLIVSAVNDPLTSAEYVAELMAPCTNPNVAALILAGGGHVGFAPYATDYYFNLILNFFDAHHGPAAVSPPSTTGPGIN